MATSLMDRNLVLEFARVTEAAALNCAQWIGKGEKNLADGAAVEAMRKMFDTVSIDGTVVIGEGEMDEAPMLYLGEKVGKGGVAVDIAVDPLEGTNLTAKNMNGAIAVMAIAKKGGLLHAPDMYMDKIHEEFPQYDWIKNKGYLTKTHIEAIQNHGVTKYHRLSFLKNITKSPQKNLEAQN